MLTSSHILDKERRIHECARIRTMLHASAEDARLGPG